MLNGDRETTIRAVYVPDPANRSDMTTDRTIPAEVRSRMVRAIDPTATVREATLADSGHLAVYHLVVDTPDGTDEWVLKASPDGGRHGIGTEARILTIVDDRTSIPVPGVLGVVDEYESLPAPFFVMERVEGEPVPKREIGALSDGALERIARESGRYLAELHALEGPEGYGRVEVVPSTPLAGDRPAVDLDAVTVADLQGASATDPTAWPAVLRTWTEETLERHASTRFGDLTGTVRPTVLEWIESMDGPFRPALGRIDHGLHNCIVEPESGEITGLIDWAFTLSVPAAYDLVCVEANLSLGPWSVHPETPDRRELVRTSLLDGYRSRGSADVLDRFHRHHDVYELLALCRAMNHLDRVPEFVMSGATDAQVDATATAYRDLVTASIS